MTPPRDGRARRMSLRGRGESAGSHTHGAVGASADGRGARDARQSGRVSCIGHDTKVLSGSTPPSVMRRCGCGCQWPAIHASAGTRRCRPRGRALRSGDGRGAGGDAGDLAEQATARETVRAQPLGDREHHVSVRHGREEQRVQPLHPDRQALGVAAGAEVAALARKREQALVRATVAADAGELNRPRFGGDSHL